MKLRRLIQGIPVLEVRGRLDLPITHLTAHSRDVVPGSLFVALRGQRQDGHRFVPEALRRGARVVVGEREVTGIPSTITWIRVQDTREVLPLLARRYYGEPDQALHLLAVTGTNGKTTTGGILRSILEQTGHSVGWFSTVGCQVGSRTWETALTTPDPLTFYRLLREMVDMGCRFAVVEVSSHALSQHRIDGVSFDVAVFTNLSRDHLDYHGDMESYFRTKARLFHPPLLRGRAILCGEDPYGKRLLESLKGSVWSYGVCGPWDLTVEGLSLSLQGSVFRVHSPLGTFSLETILVGLPNVYNVLGAAAAALALGLSVADIQVGVRRFPGIPGRLEVFQGDRFQVVVDYAHTPDALERVLQTLHQVARPRRILTVFGCGGERDPGKRPQMGRIAAHWSEGIILTNDNPRGEDPAQILAAIAQGIEEACREGKAQVRSWEIIEDRRAAIERAIQWAGPGDVVLVAGRGHETVQIIGGERRPLADRRVVSEVLRQMVPSP